MSFHERETEEIQHSFLSESNASPYNALAEDSPTKSENRSKYSGLARRAGRI